MNCSPNEIKRSQHLLVVLTLVASVFFSTLPSVALSQSSKSLRERSVEQSVEQTAEILGSTTELSSFLSLSKRSDLNEGEKTQLRDSQVNLMRKILLGFLDVRSACSKIDTELAYTYELSQRHQQKVDTVNQVFNFTNFMQSGTLYTIEGRSKLHKQDKQAYILTTIGAGLSAALPTLNILYNKHNKVGHVVPPESFAHVFDGGPVNDEKLPVSIRKFLNSSEPGQSQSRRARMAAVWKQRYKVDLSNESTLCALTRPESKSPALLKKRIVLLWSLHAFVQEFDNELLSLLEVIKNGNGSNTKINDTGSTPLSGEIADAAGLLEIDSQLATLLKLRSDRSQKASCESLDTEILLQVLWGALNTQVAIDKIDSELNYAYDVVLAQLLSKRARIQQRLTEANFINKGTLNAVGGFLDLKGYTKAADEVFVTANGIGIGISSLALVEARGGKRKIDTPQNSLTDIFGLEEKSSQRISPLVMRFLNSRDSQTDDGKTRKDTLFEIWKRNHVSTVNLNSRKTQEQLAALSPDGYDTIKIVVNRIALLQSLRVRLSSFNLVLLKLLRASEPLENLDETIYSADQNRLSESAVSAASLLGVQLRTRDNASIETIPEEAALHRQQELSLLRRILTATLELKTTSSNIETEIAHETQALSRMTRVRDLAITLTNNANFYQAYILGTILYGPLGLSSSHRYSIYSDRLKIISGFLSIGLGAASLLEHHGGFRLSSVEPNMLGPCFDLKSKAESKYSPLVWRFINSVSPNSPNKISRRQELIAYWRNTKLLNLDFKSRSALEKVSATGRAHRRIDETIKLATDRVSMLYDLRAVVNLMDLGLGDLLRTF